MNDDQRLSVIERMARADAKPLATAASNREVRDTIPDGRAVTISGALAAEPVDRSSTDPQTAKKHPLAAKKFRLGVLLVHGIGTQPPRDTLVRWGDVLLKVIGRATKTGSSLFRVGDLKDPASLVVKLRDARDLLSQYLRGQLSSDTQQQLDEYDGSSPPSESLQRALIDGLNQQLRGSFLYDEVSQQQRGSDLSDEQPFAQVSPRPSDARQLTEKAISVNDQIPLGGELMIRLNRLFVERAYPHEIAKNQTQVNAMVERGRPGDGSGDKPAEVEIRIRADGKEERWLLAEGWWAGSFPAPSYKELVSWSVRAVTWSIAIHIAQRFWQEESQESVGAKALAYARALAQLLVALALAPVFVLLLALALLLGLLPIPQLRAVILSAQSTLIGTVGDSLAFVESPVRAAFIGTRILEGLERLKETCERTVIVAHSQGAAVVLDALGGFVESEDEPNAGTGLEPPPLGPVPDALLTFGSGINQLASLRLLSAGLPKKLGLNPANSAAVALLVTAGLLGLLYADVQAQRTTFTNILQAIGLFLVLLGISGILFWAASKWLSSKLAGRRKAWRDWILVALILVTNLAMVIYADMNDLPIGSVLILLFALIILAGSLKMILSSEMKEVVTKRVRKPPGLTRWIDLYASADPVPNGKTRAVKDVTLESVPISNLGSLLSDHTAYWDNLDGFVLRVARVCAETAESEWRVWLPRETPDVDERAAWRVGFLRLARWINGLAWLVSFVLLCWKRYEQRMPMPFDLPTWLPSAAPTAARFALLAAVVALAAWATSSILRWPWKFWVRAEQKKVLDGVPPEGKPWMPLIGMGMIVNMVLGLLYAITRGDSSVVSRLRADRGGVQEVLIDMLAPMIGGAFILAAVAFWLRPEPQPSEAPDHR